MKLFKGQSLLEFTERFKTDLDCEEYLASLKWEDGYCCRKCGHKKYQVRKDFSRTCNICGDTESPTAGTLFHRLKFGLRKAFFICFEMTTTTKGLSASQVARRYEISRQTAHYFMQKVREAMKSSESHKMNDSVQVDEFTIGGKEEGIAIHKYSPADAVGCLTTVSNDPDTEKVLLKSIKYWDNVKIILEEREVEESNWNNKNIEETKWTGKL